MDELAKRFADLAENYGPTVANAALEAARVEAYSNLMSGVLSGIFAAVCGYFTAVLTKKVLRERWDGITWLPISFLAVGAAIAGCISVWAFIDPWTWTAINHPELWIAKKAFRL